MNLSVIVAKIDPVAQDEVAAIWAESDRTELPYVAGVVRRSLFRLDDLYIHLLETERPGDAAVAAAGRHPEFARISERLHPFITPYLATWASPKDAQATCFYEWAPDPNGAPRTGGSR